MFLCFELSSYCFLLLMKYFCQMNDVLLIVRFLKQEVSWQWKTWSHIRLLKGNQWPQHFSVSSLVHWNFQSLCTPASMLVVDSYLCHCDRLFVYKVEFAKGCRVCVPDCVFIFFMDVMCSGWFWSSGITMVGVGMVHPFRRGHGSHWQDLQTCLWCLCWITLEEGQ